MLNGNNVTKKKIFFVCLIIVCSILIISSVVVIFIKKHEKEMSYQLEDKNGDENKELAIITDEMIEACWEDYHAYKRHVFRKTDGESGIVGEYEDCDSKYIETEIKMLTGVYICNAFLGDGETVTYKIESKVSSGNLKIVITDETDKILYTIPIDSNETISFITEKSKTYYVKFVGERAEIDITVLRES